jgi:putative DNA primase/helicase
VFIHESAIKAVNGARLGTYSVGLNGVWGWGSRKHEIALLPELRDIPWRALDLTPVILFDTNIATSQQVELAAKRLAVKLFEVTGRTAKLLRLIKDNPDDEDFGFDDYAVRVGDPTARLFLDTPTEDLEDIDTSEVELIKLDLNSKVAVVRSMSRVADIESGALMTTSAFTDLVYAHYQATVLNANGEPREVSVPKLWLKDPRKTQVEALAYIPGAPRITAKQLNTWRGMGLAPQADPLGVEQWLTLLAHNTTPEIAEWILDWLAYPLQNLGAKLNSLLLLFGPSGTGKDLFLRPLHTLYGMNAVKISNDELKSSFTSLYAAKQFIHADELKRVHNAADAVNQKIKGIVTNQFTTVNRKGDPEYKIKNVANLVITSNYYDCIKLDEDDRRAAVVRWSPQHPSIDMRGVQTYWRPLAVWLCSSAGAAAVYAYLLNRDLTHFDAAAWAPETDAKHQVIDAARNPIERYVAQLREDPQLHLPPLTDGRCLFTAKELAMYHYGQEPAKGQVDALSNELRNQNFIRANGDKSIRTKSGVNRWWVVPRPDCPKQDWTSSSTCTQHLKAHGF